MASGVWVRSAVRHGLALAATAETPFFFFQIPASVGYPDLVRVVSSCCLFFLLLLLLYYNAMSRECRVRATRRRTRARRRVKPTCKAQPTRHVSRIYEPPRSRRASSKGLATGRGCAWRLRWFFLLGARLPKVASVMAPLLRAEQAHQSLAASQSLANPR